jgi:hypothetical protein
MFPFIFPVTVKSLGIVTVVPDNGWIVFTLNVLIGCFVYKYEKKGHYLEAHFKLFF